MSGGQGPPLWKRQLAAITELPMFLLVLRASCSTLPCLCLCPHPPVDNNSFTGTIPANWTLPRTLTDLDL